MTQQKQNIWNKEFGIFLAMPAKARKACVNLLVALVIKAVCLGACFYAILFGKIPDSMGWIIVAVATPLLALMCVALVLAITHLYQGRRSGHKWAWVALPIMLLGFPMMTIVAMHAIIGLNSHEMERYILDKEAARRQASQGFPVVSST